MNLKNRKSFLLAAGIVIVLGLMACLLTSLPCGQKTAVPNPRNDPIPPVPISEYNKLVEAENQMVLVVSNLQAAALQQRQELTNVNAKLAELELRTNRQESEAETLPQTNLSETLKRVDRLQLAVIRISLGVQELQSRAKPPPSSGPN